MHGDVGVDLLAGDELELVDDSLVVRVGHRHEDPVAPHQHGQDAMRIGDLARHDVDLREVDAGHAVLLGERSQRVDLVDGPLAHEDRRQRGGRHGPLLST